MDAICLLDESWVLATSIPQHIKVAMETLGLWVWLRLPKPHLTLLISQKQKHTYMCAQRPSNVKSICICEVNPFPILVTCHTSMHFWNGNPSAVLTTSGNHQELSNGSSNHYFMDRPRFLQIITIISRQNVLQLSNKRPEEQKEKRMFPQETKSAKIRCCQVRGG